MRLGERVEIKIRNKFDGETIFAYTCRDNTLGRTVKAAHDCGVSLKNADLVDADLYNLNLKNIDLCNANLYRANLDNADLSYAKMIDTKLAYSSLTGANLYKVDLTNADLTNANLSFANLYHACLSYSNLHSHFTVDIDFIQRILAYLVSLNCNDPKAKEIREKILSDLTQLQT